MQDTDFYHQILGLDSSWRVAEVDLDMPAGKVEIRAEFCGEAQCAECNDECPRHDLAPERKWRHLDTCQLQTVLVAKVPRTNCAEHGVLTMKTPWSEPHGRFTAMFEQVVIQWLLATRCQSAVAKQLRLSFDQVHSIMERAVERGLARRDDSPVKYVGIDEKSMKKGHRYMTVVSDLDTGRVLEVSESRTQKSAEEALRGAVPKGLRDKVSAVCTDMWPAFMNAAASVLPNAKMVHDRFHVSKHLNDAIDKTRREEQRGLLADGEGGLKNARYLFMRNFPDVAAGDLIRFEEARTVAEKTTKVWESKETFRMGFWMQSTVASAHNYLSKWCESAIKKGISALTRVANMIASHAEGLTNYILHPISNARAENLNGKIQHLKASARGFRSFKNYRINIFFYHGHLDLNPLRIP